MPTPRDIASTAVLVITRDILPPIVETLEKKNKDLEDKIQKQNESIELLKQQVSFLMREVANRNTK